MLSGTWGALALSGRQFNRQKQSCVEQLSTQGHLGALPGSLWERWEHRRKVLRKKWCSNWDPVEGWEMDKGAEKVFLAVRAACEKVEGEKHSTLHTTGVQQEGWGSERRQVRKATSTHLNIVFGQMKSQRSFLCALNRGRKWSDLLFRRITLPALMASKDRQASVHLTVEVHNRDFQGKKESWTHHNTIFIKC